MMDCSTYIITALQYFLHMAVHVMMIERHKQRIHHNTQRNKEFDERIEHNKRYPTL